MLSYQHEYHAGNHADLLKHSALCLILDSLCKKEKPFTVIDTHASAGRFSLEDERLLKTGEAKSGIEKVFRFWKSTSVRFPEAFELYLSLEKEYLLKKTYAGSPELERLFLRERDVLHLVEKHPQAHESLVANCRLPLETAADHGRFRKVNIYKEDSFEKLRSLVPPVVKRGLIFCDPSFEDASDYRKVTESLSQAHKKWGTAIIALWYPLILKKKNETEQMLTFLEDAGKLGTQPCESIRVELRVKDPAEIDENEKSTLYGSGVFIMNPPWQLQEKLEETAEFISKLLDRLE